jgi:predicted NUDIX family phosphoesterase
LRDEDSQTRRNLAPEVLKGNHEDMNLYPSQKLDPEFVWVVRRGDLFPSHYPQGFWKMEGEWDPTLDLILKKGFFVERREAETEPSWKQCIPYCLLTHQDQILLLERLPAQTETRLHGLLSIGIGGHINPCDLEGPSHLIENSAHREIQEEARVELADPPQFLGFVNDDGTEVGAVHLGIVLTCRAKTPPRVKETEKMQGRLEPLVKVKKMCDSSPLFETWSSAILASLDLGGGNAVL